MPMNVSITGIILLVHHGRIPSSSHPHRPGEDQHTAYPAHSIWTDTKDELISSKSKQHLRVTHGRRSGTRCFMLWFVVTCMVEMGSASTLHIVGLVFWSIVSLTFILITTRPPVC